MTDSQDWWATPQTTEWAAPVPTKDPQPLGWGLVLAAVGIVIGAVLPWASIGFDLSSGEGFRSSASDGFRLDLGSVFSHDISGADLNGGVLCIILAVGLAALGVAVGTGARLAQARLFALLASGAVAVATVVEVLYLRSKDPTSGAGRIITEDLGFSYRIEQGPWVVLAAAAIAALVALLLRPTPATS